MSKGAVSLRMKTPFLSVVERALAKGEIICMHVLRPTWHYVAVRNMRWMCQISGPRIKAAWTFFARNNGLSTDDSFLGGLKIFWRKFSPAKTWTGWNCRRSSPNTGCISRTICCAMCFVARKPTDWWASAPLAQNRPILAGRGATTVCGFLERMTNAVFFVIIFVPSCLSNN